MILDRRKLEQVSRRRLIKLTLLLTIQMRVDQVSLHLSKSHLEGAVWILLDLCFRSFLLVVFDGKVFRAISYVSKILGAEQAFLKFVVFDWMDPTIFQSRCILALVVRISSE